MGSLQGVVADPLEAPKTASAPTTVDVPAISRAAAGWKYFAPAIAICLVMLRSRVRLLLIPQPVYDFMTYWAAGRLFLAHANPYSAAAMYHIELNLGWQYAQSLVLLNPPWALPIVSLLGILPFAASHALWLAISVVLEAVSGVVLWRYFGGAKRLWWMGLALAFTFLPCGSAEHMGQITPLMLAGLTLFLWLVQREHYFAAGAALLLVGMKPQLLYLVAFAIVLWALRNRRWTLLAGAVAAYAASTAAAFCYDPATLGYFHASTQAAMDTNCGVGGLLREIFGQQHRWLQFLPSAAGIAWFDAYWRRHGRSWQWEQRLPLLLLVSMVTSPYVWAHDFVLAMPSFAYLAVRLSRTRTDWLMPSAAALVVQIVIFGVCGSLSKAEMASASALWLLLFWGGTRYLAGLGTTDASAAA